MVRSNAVSFSLVTSLKSCAKKKDLNEGIRLHEDILKLGLLDHHPYVGNTLLSMYAKCGALVKAHQVLAQLSIRDNVSWSALIVGYVQKGQGNEALHCYEQMQSEGLSANAFAYSCILKACGMVGALDKGKQIHDEISSQGLLEHDVVLGTALVDMYSKCGELVKAQEVLDHLPARNLVSWSALITGYAQKGLGDEALNCYERMQGEGLSPDAITYSCILKACGISKAVDKGKQIHDEIISQGLLGNVVVGTALVDMYAKCGMLTKAQEVLEELPTRNTICWSALITGYVQKGLAEEALICYERALSEGLCPNAITYACILTACAIAGAVDRGKQIHDEIVSQGMLERDVVLGNALVDMYAKCSVMTRAQEVLDKLPFRDIVSWSALIAGYVQEGQYDDAFNCYDQMQSEGICPTEVTYTCILKACGMIQDTDRGKEVHDEIVSEGLLEDNIVLGSALVDMYVKCGVLSKAEQVLAELPASDVVSWNALIAGYAQQGLVVEAAGCLQRMQSTAGIVPDVVSWTAQIGAHAQQGQAEDAMDCFHEMLHQGITPNADAFVYILIACSHSGLLKEGIIYCEIMTKQYDIRPDMDHYTCIVDLFGRAGQFDKAMTAIEKMPSSDHLPVWSSLLGACQKWGSVELGRFALDHAVQLDESCAAAYVCMANIYAAAGMKEDARRIQAIHVEMVDWSSEDVYNSPSCIVNRCQDAIL